MTVPFALLRPAFANGAAALAALATMELSACSPSQPRDINYGTDVGLSYVPGADEALSADASSPDSTADDSADATSADSAADISAGSAAPDGGISVDAAVE